jgi:hypothetical protein
VGSRCPLGFLDGKSAMHTGHMASLNMSYMMARVRQIPTRGRCNLNTVICGAQIEPIVCGSKSATIKVLSQHPSTSCHGPPSHRDSSKVLPQHAI